MRPLLFPVAALLLACAPAVLAAPQVSGAWTRALPPVSANGAVYLTLVNDGPQADRLLGASTPAAAMVHLHAASTESGVMSMRSVDTLDLAPGATVTLAPGGRHLMLMGLTGPLREGDTLPLTLRFEQAGTVEVAVPVLGVGASGPP